MQRASPTTSQAEPPSAHDSGSGRRFFLLFRVGLSSKRTVNRYTTSAIKASRFASRFPPLGGGFIFLARTSAVQFANGLRTESGRVFCRGIQASARSHSCAIASVASHAQRSVKEIAIKAALMDGSPLSVTARRASPEDLLPIGERRSKKRAHSFALSNSALSTELHHLRVGTGQERGPIRHQPAPPLE